MKIILYIPSFKTNTLNHFHIDYKLNFRLELTPEIEANWRSLASIALESQDIIVAEHCFAALGDIAKATYLRKTYKMGQNYEQDH